MGNCCAKPKDGKELEFNTEPAHVQLTKHKQIEYDLEPEKLILKKNYDFESIKDIALETLATTLKESIGLEEVYFSFAK